MTLTDRIAALMATKPTIRYVDETFSWEKTASREEIAQMVGMGGGVLNGVARVELGSNGIGFFYAPPIDTPPDAC